MRHLVQMVCRRKIVTEWLLNDHPAPAPILMDHPRLAEAYERRFIDRRRRGQVEEAVGAAAVGFFRRSQASLKLHLGALFCEVTADIMHFLGKAGPVGFDVLVRSKFLHGGLHLIAEGFAVEVGARHPDQLEVVRQPVLAVQAEQRGDQLPFGQVA